MNKVYARCFQVLIVLLFSFDINSGAKILFVLPSPGYSQYILAEPLFVALAERGHNVTVISGFKTEGVKNLRNIQVDLTLGVDMPPDLLFKLQELSIFGNIVFLNQFCLSFTEKILSDNTVQALINSEETFDLVTVETFLSEALQAFAKHFNAHQVLFSSTAISEWNSHLIGIPNVPSYLPISFAGYTTYMNFNERFRNTMALIFDKYYKEMFAFPEHHKLVHKYFPKKYNLLDFIYNASLMLTCSHVSTTQTIPLTTSVVEVSGLHIKSNKLPKNIQEFLDSAENGAVFFSMGSNIESSAMSNETIEGILTVIKNLQQKVLWKFGDENLKNQPDNLMVSKWFPQTDILAHSNTVAFISHCGMGSTTEAVYHGVPVVGIPIYGDQFMNVRKLVQNGMAVELPFKQLNIKTLNDSVQEILYNQKYKHSAKRLSSIFNDRPMQPLEEAVYWIEYVLKHDGAHHLKSSILTLSWYQLYLLDIVTVILLALTLFSYIIYILFHWITRTLRKSKTKRD